MQILERWYECFAIASALAALGFAVEGLATCAILGLLGLALGMVE